VVVVHYPAFSWDFQY